MVRPVASDLHMASDWARPVFPRTGCATRQATPELPSSFDVERLSTKTNIRLTAPYSCVSELGEQLCPPSSPHDWGCYGPDGHNTEGPPLAKSGPVGRNCIESPVTKLPTSRTAPHQHDRVNPTVGPPDGPLGLYKGGPPRRTAQVTRSASATTTCCGSVP